jgi:hypothetical protein
MKTTIHEKRANVKNNNKGISVKDLRSVEDKSKI